MIIRYSFPQFEESILDGIKIHTFRHVFKKRWRAGMSIQHYMYSYMNPKSFKFLDGECKEVQEVKMMRVENGEHWILHNKPTLQHRRVHELFIVIDEHLYIDDECLPIMANDGLTQGEFMDFFLPKAVNGLGKKDLCWIDTDTDKFQDGVWKGRCIHWTEKRY